MAAKATSVCAKRRVHAIDIDNGQDTWKALRWLAEHREARPAVVALASGSGAMPVAWEPGVRKAGLTPQPKPDEWVVVSLARWPLVQRLMAEKRRRVARPAPAIVVFAPGTEPRSGATP